MSKFIDLTGRKFGKLTVISQYDTKWVKNLRWNCICDCGNTAIVQGNNLRSGNSTCCGQCGKVRTHGMYAMNKYDLTGEYGIGWTAKGEEFWFDLEDYDKIKDYSWFYNYTSGYVETRLHNYGKNTSLHRLIMSRYLTKEKPVVDHINRPVKPNLVYDNRKCNLRVCTVRENSINRCMQRNNTTGIIGVWKRKNQDVWVAELIFNGKKHYLGSYRNKEDATKARKEGEAKYFGEYAYRGKEHS